LNIVFQSVFKRQVLNDIYGQKSAKSESNIEKFLIDCSKHIDPSNFLFVENGSKSLKKIAMLLFVSLTLLSTATLIDKSRVFALPDEGSHSGFGGLSSLGTSPSPGKAGPPHLNSPNGLPHNVKSNTINPNNIHPNNINPNNIHPNNINPNNAKSAAHCTGFGLSINSCRSNEIHRDNSNHIEQHCTGYGVSANPCDKAIDPCLINPCPVSPCNISPCHTSDGKVVVGTESTANSYNSSPIIINGEQSTYTTTNNANDDQEKELSSGSIPVANAGSDKNTQSLNRVTLDGSKSYDPDGKKIDYSWLQLAGGPIVSLSNSNSIKPTFEAPQVTESTTLTFQLIINNNDAVSSPSYVTITVEP